MNELIDSIVDRPKLALFFAIFLAICILVIVAIMLDLWDGVHTARKTGEKVHSHKLRVTIAKISEYFRFIAIGFLIDCIGIVFAFYIMPFVAVLFGVGLIAVEAKSMFEHASRRKSHTAELPDIARAMVNCHNIEDAMKIIGLLSEKQEHTYDKPGSYVRTEITGTTAKTKDTLHEMSSAMFEAPFMH